ncbi:helix-turn-helix domain-containing protein [Baia soyae]|uniref:Helix-turn-helix protein n=1 Tax=Baia soyae TaxID=1544746 RepID=A0A4R2S242_9BACL|nr:helix-turn-helix transcriptional regulator [Baia soyae]TCP70373.1 helix-turn-helix protein [Baia soyae]
MELFFYVTEELGQAIEKARKERGFTQEEVDDLTGCSASNLYLIEKGYKRVKYETIEKICRFYGIDISKYQSQQVLEEMVDLDDFFQLVDLEMRIHPDQAMEMFRQYESKIVHLHGRNPELTVLRYYAKAKQAEASEKYQDSVEYYLRRHILLQICCNRI